MTVREQIKTQIDIMPEPMLDRVMSFIQQHLTASPVFNVPETDDPDDIAAYDAAVAEDDGYRISAADFRKKYGI